MTDLNNSNVDDERENAASGGNDLDAAWAAFEAEHRDELKDVAGSSSARKFERHAQRKEKEALLNVDDLTADSFAHGNAGARSRGPRDFSGSSWLDTDEVMDRYGEDFVPPNPSIGPVNKAKALFWILLVVGIAGIIASVFVPALTGFLGSVFGLCALLGAAGLIIRHRGHRQTRTDEFDDGARV
ncbi:hypothetical protein H7U32_03970 [Bifidobacterium pullorum subsp. saeculare]|uniref:Membrane associated protein n=1 Tax=Bifidobacterium pullorum subsp. saeculare TaxID=78257 RepID=A0A938WYR1_9BIFI|nr:hypothetical protein [Bifidobacterium pullorum]MBM6699488.1 hypothetical protein [Bifidobacterium pullorum subsp. saeculare]